MSNSAMLTSVRRLRCILAGQQGREQSDEQLLAAFADHRDDIAFATLVHRHGPMVLGVCRRVLGHVQDAEDAHQATFLVLARRAAALRDKTALASFLHGAAYHLAAKVKRAAGRRRKHEGRAPARASVSPADELLWREVRALLDEEIARLPEAYRSVFVLCCLENLSQAEAARRLGLKERTASNRLAEARKRLSGRLARRGVELTAVLTATTLAASQASALPVALAAKTVEGALATAAGEGLAGMVSAAVAELVQGATATMMLSKTKIAVALLLATSMLAGAGVWAYRGLAASVLAPARESAEPTAAKADAKKTASPKAEDAKTVAIQGRVLGPDGKPKAGAKLLLLGEEQKITELGVTAADGQFSVLIPKDEKRRYLIARTNDTGIDVRWTGNFKPGKPVELRLVKDQPIRGRVVNTEGKPVPNVRVTANDFNTYPNNSLDRFLAYWKGLHVPQNPLYGGPNLRNAAGALFATTTDADGRFILKGLGEERFISLRLRGAGIADVELWIATRPNFDPKPFNKAVHDNTEKNMLELFGNGRQLHGPDVTVIAEAEKIVRGVVKDADTGNKLPNVLVQLISTFGSDFQARTDTEGRYEIRGVRKAKAYSVQVRSDPITGYMGSQVHTEDTPGYQLVAADIPAKKGVFITGKMIDQSTGKPIDGSVRVVALKDNPFVKNYSGFDSAAWNSVEVTDANGAFRIVAIPGPVLLMGGPRQTYADFKYENSIVDPKYRQYFRTTPNYVAYYRLGGGFSPIMGVFFKVLEIKADAKVVEQNIVLQRLPAITVQIQDIEGKPLKYVLVTGLKAEGHYPIRYAEFICSAYGVQPGKPRLMLFYQDERKLAGTLTLKGDENPPVAVKLGPAGAIKGRLLDADSKPLAGVRVDLRYHHRDADAMHRSIHEEKQIVTDAKGNFTHEEVLPGFAFELSLRRGRRRFQREAQTTEAVIQVKPGECRDLGTFRLKPLPE